MGNDHQVSSGVCKGTFMTTPISLVCAIAQQSDCQGPRQETQCGDAEVKLQTDHGIGNAMSGNVSYGMLPRTVGDANRSLVG